MSTAKHTSAYRDRNVQKGLCPCCGVHPDRNGKNCSVCLGNATKSNRRRLQARYDAGLCVQCGDNPYEAGKKSCTVCCQKRKDSYQAGDKDLKREQALQVRSARRRRILEHYGNKCVCCGETESSFLAIDHINGGGNEHRRQIGNNPGNRCGSSSTQFAKWIEKNDFPDTLQLLCHNCNMGKHLNDGICPHKARISQGILR